MAKYKMTCPDCQAVIMTASPAALVWELCPSCRSHVWDTYDVMMVEISFANLSTSSFHHVQANN